MLFGGTKEKKKMRGRWRKNPLSSVVERERERARERVASRDVYKCRPASVWLRSFFCCLVRSEAVI